MVHLQDYGAVSRRSGRGQTVKLSAAVALTAVCAVVAALVGLQGTSHVRTELDSSVSQDAFKLAQQVLASGTADGQDALQEAAESLRELESARVLRAKEALAHEEQRQKAIDLRTAQILKSTQSSQQQISVAEARYKQAKKAAINAAAVAIERAAIARKQAEGAAQQKLGANHDKFIDLNPPSVPTSQKDPFADLDPPIVKAKARREHKTQHLSKVQSADAKVVTLRKELDMAQAQAAKAKRKMTHLAEDSDAAAEGDKDEEKEEEVKGEEEEEVPAPDFYENYKKGMLGPGAISKLIPADRAEGHKDCMIEDINCDELWPWGKISKDQLPKDPVKRSGPLGDNLVGLSSGDDVVVPTEDSGLIPHGKPYVDQFSHWPVNSKKNKDLLYGRGRYIISKKYLGVGDQYVPFDKVEDMSSKPMHKGSAIADLMFGSWEQGFHKPHNRVIKKDVNMFNQPYRQHWSVAHGKGHQVYTHRVEPPGPTLGEADDEE